MWNATDAELKAAEIIKVKMFWLVNEYNDCIDDKNFRQQLKSLYCAWIIMTDTEPDRADSDRLLYDLWNEINKYPTKWKFKDYEDMMIRMFY